MAQALEQKRIDTLASTLTLERGERTALRRRELAKGDGVAARRVDRFIINKKAAIHASNCASRNTCHSDAFTGQDSGQHLCQLAAAHVGRENFVTPRMHAIDISHGYGVAGQFRLRNACSGRSAKRSLRSR
jgi:hypothetical protein